MTSAERTSAGVSFLPDGYLARRERRRAARGGVSVLAVAALSIAATWGYADWRHCDIDRRYAQAIQRYEAAGEVAERAERLIQREQLAAKRADAAAQLLGGVPGAAILAEISRSAPAGVSIDKVAVRKRTLPASEGHAASETLVLELTATAAKEPEIAEFVDRLNRTRLVHDIDLKCDQPGATSFQIAAFVDPSVLTARQETAGDEMDLMVAGS